MVGWAIAIWLNENLGFKFLDSNFGRNFLRGGFLIFWMGFSLLKHDSGLQKIIFDQILINMTPVEFCILEKLKILQNRFFQILSQI